jgi:hypothetical protein
MGVEVVYPNRFIERLWRSVKQEDIYGQDYADGLTAQRGLAHWFGAKA